MTILVKLSSTHTFLLQVFCKRFRCKGFLSNCLSPNFKLLRLAVSYYTAHIQFPIANTSETASIFLTTLLSIERYLTMHKLSYPCPKKHNCSLCCIFGRGRCQAKSNKKSDDSHYNELSSGCGFTILNKLLKPFTHICSLSNENAKTSIVKVIVLSIILNVPLFFTQRVYIRYNTETNSSLLAIRGWRVDVASFGKSKLYTVYTWLRTGFLQILPLLFLCVINFFLFKFFRIANRRWRHLTQRKTTSQLTTETSAEHDSLADCNPHESNAYPLSKATKMVSIQCSQRQSAQRKLTILLIAIVCLFLTGQIPQALAFASIYQGILSPVSLKCSPTYRLYRVISHCICLITYSANFVLYATLNSHFKKQLLGWLPFKKCCSWKSNKGLSSQQSKTYGVITSHVDALKPRMHTEALSADYVHNMRRKEQISTGPVSDISPRGTYSDRVWYASVAVISKNGGRPVALATAKVNPSPSLSTSSQLHSLKFQHQEKTGDSQKQTFLQTIAESNVYISPISSNGNSLFQFNVKNNKYYLLNTILKPGSDQDVEISPDDRILFRISSHSKRFWVKRWKTLGKQYTVRSSDSYQTLLKTLPEVKPSSDNEPLFVQMETKQAQSHDEYDENKQFNVFLQSIESWLHPSKETELNALRNYSHDALSKYPVTYYETHLDDIL